MTLRPYFALKPSMTPPKPHQSCGSAMVVSSPSALAAATRSSIASAKAAVEDSAKAIATVEFSNVVRNFMMFNFP